MFEHRLSVVLALTVFFLILWGGVVHNTGSSLACPDWPLCHGSAMPEMKGMVAIEHGHRLLASTVGLWTIFLAVLLYKRRKSPPLRRLGLAAVFLVIFQGVLGGLTVIYQLPDLVSTAHLGVSMIFFAVVIAIAWKTDPPCAPLSKGGRGDLFVLVTLILIYLQMLLGAFMRHIGAGLICPEFPFCFGSLWPVGVHWNVTVHVAHRWMGVLVALSVFMTTISLWKKSSGVPLGITKTRFLLILAPLLVLIQVGLGVASLLTFLGLPAVTAHLGGAALLWATIVSIYVINPSRGNPPLPPLIRGAQGGSS